MERVKGIEPSYSAWKAAALPLSYTRAASSDRTGPMEKEPPPFMAIMAREVNARLAGGARGGDEDQTSLRSRRRDDAVKPRSRVMGQLEVQVRVNGGRSRTPRMGGKRPMTERQERWKQRAFLSVLEMVVAALSGRRRLRRTSCRWANKCCPTEIAPERQRVTAVTAPTRIWWYGTSKAGRSLRRHIADGAALALRAAEGGLSQWRPSRRSIRWTIWRRRRRS